MESLGAVVGFEATAEHKKLADQVSAKGWKWVCSCGSLGGWAQSSYGATTNWRRHVAQAV